MIVVGCIWLKLHWFDLLYVLLYNLLYNESTTNRQEIEPVRAIPRVPRTSAVYTRPPAVTVFISYSPNVGVPWQNFLIPEFGTKFPREVPLFLRDTLIFLQHSIGRGKPVCKKIKSIGAAVLIQYRRETDIQTDRQTDIR